MKLVKIRTRFDGESVGDACAAARRELSAFAGSVHVGGRIAIAVGSRGIANLAAIVKAAAQLVRERGAAPFIVPAMGSHGGATAEGQAAVLASYGITQESVGVPVVSSMETVELDRGESPARLFMDKAAFESDGVILINRIKPHTDFHGRYESGLVKMCVIGLGKCEEALEIHRRGVWGLRELIAPAAREIIARGKIIGGVALVENARDETMIVRALEAGEILAEEPALLEIARSNMPRLPAGDIDVLIIDRMGKDVSGVGMDPNVIGRVGIPGEPDGDYPRIGSIMVCGLTEASHGNALGVGLADVITRRLYEKIDFREMYENVYASSFLERAKIPVVADTASEAFSYALRNAHPADEGRLRIMRIRDTLHLEDALVSPALLAELGDRADVEVTNTAHDVFNSSGGLAPF